MVLAALVVASMGACASGDDGGAEDASSSASMTLTSAAFDNGEEIPVRFGGCPPGENLSPPLSFGGVPSEAEALAVIMVDPDAGDFVHWSILGLDPDSTGLGEDEVPPEALETMNDNGGTGYFGPCPPETHTYVFTLYALSRAAESPADVEQAAIATASLTGTYTP
jgi:Raf kinase inhibitor-like YbhB/YbcL family protein